jgi:hypothetical protein
MIATEVTAFIEIYRDYAVSNTPLFFLRKLREAYAPIELARTYSGEEIFDALREALVAHIETRTEYVSPYVFLMALARNPDGRYLKEVENLAGQERFDWFKYIWRVLVDTYSPTIITTLDTPKVGKSSPRFQNGSSDFRNIELTGAETWK